MKNKNKQKYNGPMSFKEAFEKAVSEAGYTSIKQYKSTLMIDNNNKRKKD